MTLLIFAVRGKLCNFIFSNLKFMFQGCLRVRYVGGGRRFPWLRICGESVEVRRGGWAAEEGLRVSFLPAPPEGREISRFRTVAADGDM